MPGRRVCRPTRRVPIGLLVLQLQNADVRQVRPNSPPATLLNHNASRAPALRPGRPSPPPHRCSTGPLGPACAHKQRESPASRANPSNALTAAAAHRIVNTNPDEQQACPTRPLGAIKSPAPTMRTRGRPRPEPAAQRHHETTTPRLCRRQAQNQGAPRAGGSGRAPTGRPTPPPPTPRQPPEPAWPASTLTQTTQTAPQAQATNRRLPALPRLPSQAHGRCCQQHHAPHTAPAPPDSWPDLPGHTTQRAPRCISLLALALSSRAGWANQHTRGQRPAAAQPRALTAMIKSPQSSRQVNPPPTQQRTPRVTPQTRQQPLPALPPHQPTHPAAPRQSRPHPRQALSPSAPRSTRTRAKSHVGAPPRDAASPLPACLRTPTRFRCSSTRHAGTATHARQPHAVCTRRGSPPAAPARRCRSQDPGAPSRISTRPPVQCPDVQRAPTAHPPGRPQPQQRASTGRGEARPPGRASAAPGRPAAGSCSGGDGLVAGEGQLGLLLLGGQLDVGGQAQLLQRPNDAPRHVHLRAT